MRYWFSLRVSRKNYGGIAVMRLLSFFCAAILLSGPTLLATDSELIHLKVLALQANGAISGDLAAKDWTLEVGGKTAQVVAQRNPQELSAAPQKWVLVFLPVRTPEARKLMLLASAAFLRTLPPSDSALIVMRAEKGLECLTPGFTVSPALWAKALDRLVQELPGGLRGEDQPTFILPESPVGEVAGDMKPIEAFLAKLAALELKRDKEDGGSRRNLLDDYPVEQLGSYTHTVTEALAALVNLGEVIARVSGEKQLLVISRNEIDDLASPVWSRPMKDRSDPTAPKMNPKLQVGLMRQDVTLARESLKNRFTGLGLTLHSVAGTGIEYGGALGEAATCTGGRSFRFDPDLEARLPQVLSSWAMRYDLSVQIPVGIKKPAKVDLKTTRKDVRLFAPLEY